jgi:hypothetical protein
VDDYPVAIFFQRFFAEIEYEILCLGPILIVKQLSQFVIGTLKQRFHPLVTFTLW